MVLFTQNHFFMFVLNEYLVNEHDLEHNLLNKKKFSAPKIYSANGNLSNRWYVYFSYRNPETGNLQRIKTFILRKIIIIPKEIEHVKNFYNLFGLNKNLNNSSYLGYY